MGQQGATCRRPATHPSPRYQNRDEQPVSRIMLKPRASTQETSRGIFTVRRWVGPLGAGLEDHALPARRDLPQDEVGPEFLPLRPGRGSTLAHVCTIAPREPEQEGPPRPQRPPALGVTAVASAL